MECKFWAFRAKSKEQFFSDRVKKRKKRNSCNLFKDRVYLNQRKRFGNLKACRLRSYVIPPNFSSKLIERKHFAVLFRRFTGEISGPGVNPK